MNKPTLADHTIEFWYDRAVLMEQQNERLREALQELVNHQNGCPLPKYERGWNLAMELARTALAADQSEGKE